MIVSLIGFAALLFLAFLRMPLGLALGIVGGVGFSLLASERAAISNAARLVIDSGQKYELSVLPMFILMGLLVERGGMATPGTQRLFGHLVKADGHYQRI